MIWVRPEISLAQEPYPEGYQDVPSCSTLGSFDPGLVSLPAGEVQPQSLAKLWGEDGQTVVEEFIKQPLLWWNDALRKIAAEGPESVYADPKLRVRRDCRHLFR